MYKKVKAFKNNSLKKFSILATVALVASFAMTGNSKKDSGSSSTFALSTRYNRWGGYWNRGGKKRWSFLNGNKIGDRFYYFDEKEIDKKISDDAVKDLKKVVEMMDENLDIDRIINTVVGGSEKFSSSNQDSFLSSIAKEITSLKEYKEVEAALSNVIHCSKDSKVSALYSHLTLKLKDLQSSLFKLLVSFEHVLNRKLHNDEDKAAAESKFLNELGLGNLVKASGFRNIIGDDKLASIAKEMLASAKTAFRQANTSFYISELRKNSAGVRNAEALFKLDIIFRILLNANAAVLEVLAQIYSYLNVRGIIEIFQKISSSDSSFFKVLSSLLSSSVLKGLDADDYEKVFFGNKETALAHGFDLALLFIDYFGKDGRLSNTRTNFFENLLVTSKKGEEGYDSAAQTQNKERFKQISRLDLFKDDDSLKNLFSKNVGSLTYEEKAEIYRILFSRLFYLAVGLKMSENSLDNIEDYSGMTCWFRKDSSSEESGFFKNSNQDAAGASSGVKLRDMIGIINYAMILWKFMSKDPEINSKKAFVGFDSSKIDKMFEWFNTSLSSLSVLSNKMYKLRKTNYLGLYFSDKDSEPGLSEVNFSNLEDRVAFKERLDRRLEGLSSRNRFKSYYGFYGSNMFERDYLDFGDSVERSDDNFWNNKKVISVFSGSLQNGFSLTGMLRNIFGNEIGLSLITDLVKADKAFISNLSSAIGIRIAYFTQVSSFVNKFLKVARDAYRPLKTNGYFDETTFSPNPRNFAIDGAKYDSFAGFLALLSSSIAPDIDGLPWQLPGDGQYYEGAGRLRTSNESRLITFFKKLRTSRVVNLFYKCLASQKMPTDTSYSKYARTMLNKGDVLTEFLFRYYNLNAHGGRFDNFAYDFFGQMRPTEQTQFVREIASIVSAKFDTHISLYDNNGLVLPEIQENNPFMADFALENYTRGIVNAFGLVSIKDGLKIIPVNADRLKSFVNVLKKVQDSCSRTISSLDAFAKDVGNKSSSYDYSFAFSDFRPSVVDRNSSFGSGTGFFHDFGLEHPIFDDKAFMTALGVDFGLMTNFFISDIKRLSSGLYKSDKDSLLNFEQKSNLFDVNSLTRSCTARLHELEEIEKGVLDKEKAAQDSLSKVATSVKNNKNISLRKWKGLTYEGTFTSDNQLYDGAKEPVVDLNSQSCSIQFDVDVKYPNDDYEVFVGREQIPDKGDKISRRCPSLGVFKAANGRVVINVPLSGDDKHAFLNKGVNEVHVYRKVPGKSSVFVYKMKFYLNEEGSTNSKDLKRLKISKIENDKGFLGKAKDFKVTYNEKKHEYCFVLPFNKSACPSNKIIAAFFKDGVPPNADHSYFELDLNAFSESGKLEFKGRMPVTVNTPTLHFYYDKIVASNYLGKLDFSPNSTEETKASTIDGSVYDYGFFLKDSSSDKDSSAKDSSEASNEKEMSFKVTLPAGFSLGDTLNVDIFDNSKQVLLKSVNAKATLISRNNDWIFGDSGNTYEVAFDAPAYDSDLNVYVEFLANGQSFVSYDDDDDSVVNRPVLIRSNSLSYKSLLDGPVISI